MGLFFCISSVHHCVMIYGYARVSTDGQSVAAQETALSAAGASKIHIPPNLVVGRCRRTLIASGREDLQVEHPTFHRI